MYRKGVERPFKGGRGGGFKNRGGGVPIQGIPHNIVQVDVYQVPDLFRGLYYTAHTWYRTRKRAPLRISGVMCLHAIRYHGEPLHVTEVI